MGLARKSLLVIASSWATTLLSFIQGVVVIAYLGASGRGEIVVFHSLAAIMAFLLSFGLPASAVYFSRREIFSLQVILVSYTSILLPILLLVTAFALCNFDTILIFTGWPTPSVETMVLVMLSVSFLTCSNLGSSMLLAAGRAKPVAMINVAKVFSAVIFSYVALVHFSVGVRALIVGFVFLELCAAVSAVYLILPQRLVLGSASILDCQKSLISYGLRAYPSPALPNAQTHYANLVVARLVGADAVAYLALAASVYQVAVSFVKPVASLLVGEVVAKGYQNPHRRILEVTLIVTYGTAIIASALALLSYYFVPLVYGEDFSAALAPIFLLLLAAILVNSSAILQLICHVSGRPEIQSYLSISGALMLLTLLPPLVDFGGLNGAIWLILFVRLLLSAATIILFKGAYDVSYRDLCALNQNIFRHALKIIKAKL